MPPYNTSFFLLNGFISFISTPSIINAPPNMIAEVISSFKIMYEDTAAKILSKATIKLTLVGKLIFKAKLWTKNPNAVLKTPRNRIGQ